MIIAIPPARKMYANAVVNLSMILTSTQMMPKAAAAPAKEPSRKPAMIATTPSPVMIPTRSFSFPAAARKKRTAKAIRRMPPTSIQYSPGLNLRFFMITLSAAGMRCQHIIGSCININITDVIMP